MRFGDDEGGLGSCGFISTGTRCVDGVITASVALTCFDGEGKIPVLVGDKGFCVLEFHPGIEEFEGNGCSFWEIINREIGVDGDGFPCLDLVPVHFKGETLLSFHKGAGG